MYSNIGDRRHAFPSTSRGGYGRGGGGWPMHPQRAAFEGFLSPDHCGIASEHAALRFLSALQDQAKQRRGGVQEVLWDLVKPAAMHSSRQRPRHLDDGDPVHRSTNSASPDGTAAGLAQLQVADVAGRRPTHSSVQQGAAVTVQGRDGVSGDAVEELEKPPGLIRIEEFLRVAASGGTNGNDSGINRMVVPLLESVLDGGGQQLSQDRAAAEVLMQVR